MNQPYNCIYCNRYFHFKDLYENHRPACEYFYRSKRERLHSIEAHETTPSTQEIFRLVQHLTKTVRELEEEVGRLKAQNNTRVRKTVLDKLHHAPVPLQRFDAWIKTFPVKIQHLEEVFLPLNTLYDGMRKCVADRIAGEGALHVPIRSFPEKPGILYIYSDADEEEGLSAPGKWCTCSSEHWQRLIDALVHEFLRAFCVWEDQNRYVIESSPQEKDRHIQYLVKITGPHSLKERQKQDLRAWMFTQVKTPLT